MLSRLIATLFAWCALATQLVAADGPPLAGTQPLTWTEDISHKMVTDLHKFADAETAASVERRAEGLARQTSHESYRIASRDRLKQALGISTGGHGELLSEVSSPIALPKIEYSTYIGSSEKYRLDHWVLTIAPGVLAEAYALTPLMVKPSCSVILIPDTQSAEDFLGLDVWLASTARTQKCVAARLAASGCRVILPRIVDRDHEFSEVAHGLRPTPQPHREFIHRQAFEMGRSLIGYEVQLVLELVEKLKLEAHVKEYADKVIVVGYGEGGLLALYAGALNPSIDVVGVSGYFGPREQTWREPIYRTVWGLLNNFGDAELAAMIAPRKLVVEACAAPSIDAPAQPRETRSKVTPGTIATPAVADVQHELKRAAEIVTRLGEDDNFGKLVESGGGTGPAYSDDFISELIEVELASEAPPLAPNRELRDPFNQVFVQQFIVEQWTKLIQDLLHESEYVRKDYWSAADRKSRDPEKWKASCEPYRKHFYDEVLGRFDLALLPPNARTRQIYDTEKYRGYEVVLDVFGDVRHDAGVFAYGILLVPKDLKPDEKRPVVVCQHGLEGTPKHTIEEIGERHYHGFAAKLADRGFVVFSPQNPYIGNDHFRTLVRKLYPLKKTLWSVIVPQHEQITAWLASQEFVDPARIGFYGLSYGGKTAMRVPALVDRYCLSICSGDFNEWIRKCVSTRDTYSYMQTGEYEMYEFDLGHTFNYAEMAYLIAPRPFMVERGHRDGVGVDEWVSYEYAKVRMLYADLKIADRTEIEYFDGPHEIHGVGTFDFLHRHLNWPSLSPRR